MPEIDKHTEAEKPRNKKEKKEKTQTPYPAPILGCSQVHAILLLVTWKYASCEESSQDMCIR